MNRNDEKEPNIGAMVVLFIGCAIAIYFIPVFFFVGGLLMGYAIESICKSIDPVNGEKTAHVLWVVLAIAIIAFLIVKKPDLGRVEDHPAFRERYGSID